MHNGISLQLSKILFDTVVGSPSPRGLVGSYFLAPMSWGAMFSPMECEKKYMCSFLTTHAIAGRTISPEFSFPCGTSEMVAVPISLSPWVTTWVELSTLHWTPMAMWKEKKIKPFWNFGVVYLLHLYPACLTLTVSVPNDMITVEADLFHFPKLHSRTLSVFYGYDWVNRDYYCLEHGLYHLYVWEENTETN